MLSLNNTAEDILREFHGDTLRWKSMLSYKENDILFIEKLMNSKVFKVTKSNLFERLEELKKEAEIIVSELKKLKKEVNEYEAKLSGILECEDISCDTYYMENHKSLTDHFEEFYKDFNEYKTRVFNYTGGVL
jgi:predicted nuclease with TOPRIM domain